MRVAVAILQVLLQMFVLPSVSADKLWFPRVHPHSHSPIRKVTTTAQNMGSKQLEDTGGEPRHITIHVAYLICRPQRKMQIHKLITCALARRAQTNLRVLDTLTLNCITGATFRFTLRFKFFRNWPLLAMHAFGGW